MEKGETRLFRTQIAAGVRLLLPLEGAAGCLSAERGILGVLLFAAMENGRTEEAEKRCSTFAAFYKNLPPDPAGRNRLSAEPRALGKV